MGSGYGLWDRVMGYGLWDRVMGYGLWVMGYGIGLWVMGSGYGLVGAGRGFRFGLGFEKRLELGERASSGLLAPYRG